jgi:hypothetical protein
MTTLRPASIVLFVAAACSNRGINVHKPCLDLPAVVLWAWERPEDLRFVDPRQTGVAFLAATAVIKRNGTTWFQPRTQRILLPANLALLAVIRIESPFQHEAVQPEPLLAGLRQIALLTNVRAVQIDFDARGSERSFYKALLKEVRAQTTKPVSVTALASWCAGDRWLEREPIAEAVPMFFRMGRGESHDLTVESPICNTSVGLSTDEPWPAKRPRGIKRIYLFSPHPWTQAEYLTALERVRDWK